MPVVSIRHLTTYRYRKPVAFGEHRMMLRPLQTFDQRLISAGIEVSPEPAKLSHIHDLTGTCVGVARFEGRADLLKFESRALIDHTVHAPFDLETDAGVIGADRFAYDRDEAPELARAILRHDDGAADVDTWARSFLRPGRRVRLSTLLPEITAAIRRDFAYGIRLEGAPQTPAQTLASRKGSCRVFAVLLMDAARSLGLAARFVSGYVYSKSQKSRTGGGHTHAWAQVYVPGCGWVDLDPTNGIIGNEDLIRVAVTADPRLALPLYGSWAGRAGDFIRMDVEVDISIQASVLAEPQPIRRVGHGL